MNEKFEVYEEAGVKEYWVVHPQEQTILIYTLDEEKKYKGSLKPYTRLDSISPSTLPGLTINLEDVFPVEQY